MQVCAASGPRGVRVRHRVPCTVSPSPHGNWPHTTPHDPTRPREPSDTPCLSFAEAVSISISLLPGARQSLYRAYSTLHPGRWTLYTGTVSRKLVCVRLGRRVPRTPVSERTLFKLLVTLAPCSVNCQLSALRSIHRSMPAFQRACSIVTEPARSGYREDIEFLLYNLQGSVTAMLREARAGRTFLGVCV